MIEKTLIINKIKKIKKKIFLIKNFNFIIILLLLLL